MGEKFGIALWALALFFLDRAADSYIERLRRNGTLGENSAEVASQIEDWLILLLQQPAIQEAVGQYVSMFASRVASRVFKNDPSTPAWGS